MSTAPAAVQTRGPSPLVRLKDYTEAVQEVQVISERCHTLGREIGAAQQALSAAKKELADAGALVRECIDALGSDPLNIASTVLAGIPLPSEASDDDGFRPVAALAVAPPSPVQVLSEDDLFDDEHGLSAEEREHLEELEEADLARDEEDPYAVAKLAQISFDGLQAAGREVLRWLALNANSKGASTRDIARGTGQENARVAGILHHMRTTGRIQVVNPDETPWRYQAVRSTDVVVPEATTEAPPRPPDPEPDPEPIAAEVETQPEVAAPPSGTDRFGSVNVPRNDPKDGYPWPRYGNVRRALVYAMRAHLSEGITSVQLSKITGISKPSVHLTRLMADGVIRPLDYNASPRVYVLVPLSEQERWKEINARPANKRYRGLQSAEPKDKVIDALQRADAKGKWLPIGDIGRAASVAAKVVEEMVHEWFTMTPAKVKRRQVTMANDKRGYVYRLAEGATF